MRTDLPKISLVPTKEGFRWRFPAMGTQWEVQVADVSQQLAIDLVQRTVHWCFAFEQRYSRFRPDSWLSQLNASAGTGAWTELTPIDRVILDFADQAVFLSQGLIDPSSLPHTLLWDFKRKHPTPPTEAAVEHALERVGWDRLERQDNRLRLPLAGMGLDFGGFGKEFAVDQVIRILKAAACPAGLVNGGGDVAGYGTPSPDERWSVGLEEPANPGQAWTGVALDHHAVASSGAYKRFFTYQGRHYSHILNARTGHPSDSGVTACNVIAMDCFQAGVASTTACLFSPDKALAYLEETPLIEGVLHTPSARRCTSGFSNRQAVALQTRASA